MGKARLLLDENVDPLLVEALIARGFDAVAAVQAGMGGSDDEGLLKWAARERRAVLTHDLSDFVTLAGEFARRGERHWGIVVSAQVPFGVLLGRLLRLLAQRTAEDLRDRLEWLHNYR